MICLVIRACHDSFTLFAQTCAAEIIETLEEKSISFKDLLEVDATREKVEDFLSSHENHPSIVFGFGHGNTHIFTGHNDEELLFSVEDSALFYENFFYLYSCSCGQELGKKMVEYGGKGFLGYRDEVHFHAKNVLAFKRAANRGILEMIKNNCTLKDAYELTIAAYNEELERAKRTKDFLLCRYLKKNRDAFVKHGADSFVMSSIFDHH
ncbi:MAG: hypothetical protein FIB08_16025 [Candidatus Methanoperedens sp.]|nr:hypothetical protein [Candidatus Methanoperedens sp.]